MESTEESGSASTTEMTVLEYVYRDASNYASLGRLLLLGSLSNTEIKAITAKCLDREFFVAEQVGVPALYEPLWKYTDGPITDDHAFHTLQAIRPARPDDWAAEIPWGDAVELLSRFVAVKYWDPHLSPNCWAAARVSKG